MRLFKKRKKPPQQIETQHQVDVPVRFRGCDFLLPEHWRLTAQLLDGKDYEPWVLDYFLALCKPGTKVLDVGASWGGFALPAAKAVGPTGRVTAVEMLADNARILLQSARKSGLTGPLRLLPLGVSDELGSAMIRRDLSTNNQMATTIGEDEPLKGYEVLPVVTLDMLRGELGPIDLVKMDIEGMEARAIRGGLKFLAQNRPVVFLEYSPAYQQAASGADGGEVLQPFLDLGYGIEILHRKTKREAVKAADVIAYVDAAWREHRDRDKGTHLDLCLTPK